MQIKTAMRYHLTLVRMAIHTKQNKTKDDSVREDVEKLEPLSTIGEMQDGAAAVGNTVNIPPKY